MNPAASSTSSATPGSAGAGGPVIVFDGVCALCSGWVRFLLRHDRRAAFRFAAMQGALGHELLVAHGIDPMDPVSFLLVEGAAAWHDSDGVIEVLRRLGGVWRGAVLLRVLPRRLRDAGYRLLARHRYRVFGRRVACMVPPRDARDRFL